jgi:DNA-binding transcriptional LysR family regulator
MFDVRRLLLLRELDRHGTVAAAAAAAHLTPSAVSQQLAVLAREAGAVLLEPDGRRVRLTAAARVLIAHADVLAAQLERAGADLAAHQSGAVGEVTVAAFPTAIAGLIVPALRSLGRTHPGLALRIVDVHDEAAQARLWDGTVDLALAIESPAGQPHDPTRFTRVPLLVDPLDAVLPASHPLARRQRLSLAALADEQWICGLPGSHCREITVAGCAQAGFQPDVRHFSDDWTVVVALVAAGCGVALVPRLAQPEPGAGAVVRTLGADAPRRHVVALARKGSEKAPHVAAVLAALRPPGPSAQRPAASAARRRLRAVPAIVASGVGPVDPSSS